MSTTDVPSDNELMLRVRHGETDWLGMLFERHHKKLFKYFLNTIGRRHLAEDLVQEVFVLILRHGHTFRGDGTGNQMRPIDVEQEVRSLDGPLHQ